MRTNEIKNEIDETRKCEEETKGSDLKYETKIKYDFLQYETTKLYS